MKIGIERQAMQMALNALERTQSEPGSLEFEIQEEAMDALREALAASQPAQQESAITPSVRSVMQQALEALERPRSQSCWYQRSCDDAQAAKALREALAISQPEQQEPVAWGIVASNTGRICQVEIDADEVEGHNPKHIVPLYTTPQPSRGTIEWPVGSAHFHADLLNMGKSVAKQQSIPDGYVLVPAELTKEMRAAAKPCTTVSALWASIIAAAPNPAPHGITKGT